MGQDGVASTTIPGPFCFRQFVSFGCTAPLEIPLPLGGTVTSPKKHGKY